VTTRDPETIEVWVQGQRFEVRTEGLDREAALEVARYVNSKISEAASRCGPGPRLNAVVLAALDMAKEQLALKRTLEAVEEESRRLAGSIERVL
jgi:cell division protein ZapA (FtsZ GTPase activity inhibitor)